MMMLLAGGLEAGLALPAGLQFGMAMAGVVFLLVGGGLALVGVRVANAGRAAQADADARLSASQALADDVRRLTEKVEASMASRDSAIETAFLRHNDACAASMRTQMAQHAGCVHVANDDASMSPHHDDDDDDHKTHHSASASPHHDDDDDDHKKHHAAEPPAVKRSLFARLFNRQS
jgi:predicted lipid-binding transport protein (Tim44 family)